MLVLLPRLIILFNEEKCFGKIFTTFLILFLFWQGENEGKAEKRQEKLFMCFYIFSFFRILCGV